MATIADPEDVTAFLENIKIHLLAKRHTILLLHHFGKDSSRGGRGWSGLVAALDFEWEIDRDGDLRTLRVSKMRDGSDRQAALCYTFRGRELGRDQYGDSVTAAVVEHLADEESGRRQRHSPKAQALLQIVWTMIKAPNLSYRLPDHDGLRCVLQTELEREAIKLGALSRSKEDRDRRKIFVQAL